MHRSRAYALPLVVVSLGLFGCSSEDSASAGAGAAAGAAAPLAEWRVVSAATHLAEARARQAAARARQAEARARGASASGGAGGNGAGAGTGGSAGAPNTQDVFDEVKATAIFVAPSGTDSAGCGAESAPCKSVQVGVDRAAGKVGVVVRGGTYREAVTLKQGGQVGAPFTIVAYPGEVVMLSGADSVPASSWQQVGAAGGKGNLYKRSYPYSLYEHPSTSRPQDQMRPELVLVDGVPMLTVYLKSSLEAHTLNEFPSVKFSAAEQNAMKWKAPDMATLLGPAIDEVVARGVVYVEGASGSGSKTVYARFPSEKSPSAFGSIELGAREFVLKGSVSHVRIVGLTLVNAANTAKKGALDINGDDWFVRDVRVADSNALGVAIQGKAHRFLRLVANGNGQMGFFTINHHDSKYEFVEASYNNWKNFDVRWEAGGGKWTNSTKNTFTDYHARGNNGIGLWFDISNYDNTVDRALIIDNRFIGIHLEHFTERTTVKNAVIFGTKYHHNHLNGSDTSVGLRFSHASDNVVENCTIYSNDGSGIVNKYTDSRGPSLNNVVRKNLLLGNMLSPSFTDSEIWIETNKAADVSEATYQNNVYGVSQKDPVFRTGYGFAGAYSGSDVSKWMSATGATGEKQRSSNAGALQDINSPSGFKVVDPSLVGVGASL